MFQQLPTPSKFDKIWIGVLIGLICPFLGFPLVFIMGQIGQFIDHSSSISLEVFWHTFHRPDLLMKYISVGCMANLGAFFLFLQKNKINTARGIIIATILIALPVIFQIL